MTTVAELTWPAGAHRWLDSEFPPADVAAAKAALKDAGADTWAGYAPVGWPARPWKGTDFHTVLAAGAGVIALAVGPLAPTGGSAWTLGRSMATDWLAFVNNAGLKGHVVAGIDVEAELVNRNEGFAADLAAEFLATLKESGEEGGIYSTWQLLAHVYGNWPHLLAYAWGTGNAAQNEGLSLPPGYPAGATDGKRSDQWAWNVDVAGINCDLSVSEWAPPADPAAETVAPADPPATSAGGSSTATTSSEPSTGTEATGPSAGEATEPSSADSSAPTFDGLPVVEQGTTVLGPAGLYQGSVSMAKGQQIDISGAGLVAVVDNLAAVVYRGAANCSIGGEGAFLILSTEAVKWSLVTQPGA